MFDEMVVRNCAPTLAGIKVGSLFNCIGQTSEYTVEHVRSLNIRLRPYGVRLIPVCADNKPSLVYMYRPEKLRKYFMEDDVKELLSEFGYEPEDLEGCVKALVSKLFESDEFPHEIGLFLGYPSEDVRGLSRTMPAIPSVSDAGRYTATLMRQRSVSSFTTNARLSTAEDLRKAAP